MQLAALDHAGELPNTCFGPRHSRFHSMETLLMRASLPAGDDGDLLPSKEHDVKVCSQPDVESQVPTHMVRIVIDHHLVLVP